MGVTTSDSEPENFLVRPQTPLKLKFQPPLAPLEYVQKDWKQIKIIFITIPAVVSADFLKISDSFYRLKSTNVVLERMSAWRFSLV